MLQAVQGGVDGFTIADRDFGSRLIIGTGGFRNLEVMGEAVARVGRRDGDASRCGAWTPSARGSILDVLEAARLLRAPEHGRLLHRARRGDHGPAGARGARDRLGEARGDRRRQDAAARPGRAAGGRRDARGRGLHRPALHERRPDPGPPARGRRLRRGDAARLADRQRHGHPQPVQPAADRRAGARPGDPRRRHRHRFRRRDRDGGGLRRRAARQRGLARRGPGDDGAGDAQGRRGRLRGARAGPDPAAPLRARPPRPMEGVAELT